MFRADAAPYLARMLRDARNEGLDPVIISAYRDLDYQTNLFTNKTQSYTEAGFSEAAAEDMAATVVARPGTSEHHLGLAADITSGTYTALNEGQAETAEFKWLEANCYKYGFVLRYPPEKTDITGIIYEPWHFRYVGKGPAREMHESGMCLEEYLGQVDSPFYVG